MAYHVNFVLLGGGYLPRAFSSSSAATVRVLLPAQSEWHDRHAVTRSQVTLVL
jgi:hypothetical protein